MLHNTLHIQSNNYNASTNTPALATTTGYNDNIFQVTTQGIQAINGVSSFCGVGDEVIVSNAVSQFYVVLPVQYNAATSAVGALAVTITQLQQIGRIITISVAGTQTINGVSTAMVVGQAWEYNGDEWLNISNPFATQAQCFEVNPSVTTTVTSNLMNFQQQGVSAVLYPLVSKMQQTVSVKDFGAVGDGVADDTTAIINALAAAAQILFPSGTYAVSSSINIVSNKNITFQRGAKIIPLLDNLTIFISSDAYFSEMYNIQINGNGKAGIKAFDLTNFRINAVLYKPLITNCDTGIKLNSGCWDLVIDQPTFITVDKPMQVQIYGGGTQIRFPSIDGFGEVGIDISGTPGKDTYAVFIIGGYAQNGGIGVRDNAYRTILHGMNFEDCSMADVWLGSASIGFSARDCQHFNAPITSVARYVARGARIAYIDNPLKTYNNSRPLFDFDSSCQGCRQNTIVDPLGSFNLPVGITNGLSSAAFYETGTFTPVVAGSVAAGTGTYTSQSGFYTRMGNTVTFSFGVTWTSHTGTGNIGVLNMPFLGFNIGGGTFPCEVFSIATVKPYCTPVSNNTMGLRDVSGAGALSLVSMAGAGGVMCSGTLILI